jgi:predicted hotdog family 3-hydroxylacyl-ACP dehydratase
MMNDSLPPPEAVVPHKGDALLLDELLHCGEDRLVAALTVRTDTDFGADQEGLPSWTGPEIMAEAVAALAGCRSLRTSGRTAEIGLLLGVRNYEVRATGFRKGQRLQVEVVRSTEDEDGYGVFDCEIRIGNQAVASGSLTVFQPLGPLIPSSLGADIG